MTDPIPGPDAPGAAIGPDSGAGTPDALSPDVPQQEPERLVRPVEPGMTGDPVDEPQQPPAEPAGRLSGLSVPEVDDGDDEPEAERGFSTIFVAKRPVTIFGHRYEPEDVLDDPNIPGRVLHTLQASGKIVQRIDDGSKRGRAVARNPVSRASAGARVPGPAAAEAAAEGASAGEDAGGSERPDSDTAGWRALWERNVTAGKIDEDITFRQFLQAYCAAKELSENGSIADLVKRLQRNDLKPPKA